MCLLRKLGINRSLVSITTRHKLIKKIKDEKFDEDKLQRYVLLTQIVLKTFRRLSLIVTTTA